MYKFLAGGCGGDVKIKSKTACSRYGVCKTAHFLPNRKKKLRHSSHFWLALVGFQHFWLHKGIWAINKHEQRKCAERFAQSRFKKKKLKIHKTKSRTVVASIKEITK